MAKILINYIVQVHGAFMMFNKYPIPYLPSSPGGEGIAIVLETKLGAAIGNVS